MKIHKIYRPVESKPIPETKPQPEVSIEKPVPHVSAKKKAKAAPKMASDKEVR